MPGADLHALRRLLVNVALPSLRRRLKLRDLELLEVLDDVRNLNRAAKLLHTSQPALSRTLAQLEANLGVALFERTARGMIPTHYGKCLARYARQCLATLDRADEELATLHQGGRGHVVVGTNYSSAAYLLPRALTRLADEAPGVQVTVHEGPVETLLTELRAHRIDMAVARLGSQVFDVAYHTERLGDEPMCLVCGPQHPLANRTNLGWDDVLAWPWILPPKHTPVRDRLGEILHQQGLPWPHSQLESSSILVNTHLLRTSEVLSVTPLAVARHQTDLQLVCQLDFELPHGFSSLGLITLLDHAFTPAMASLAACLRQEAVLLIEQAGQ